MNNETEMKKIFKELSFQNQADLVIRARKFQILQKETKNEEMRAYERNNDVYAGIREKIK